MDHTLAKKFKFTSLLTFAIPNVIMMISLSMYIIIDGMFISRLLGTTALSSANMVYPAISFEMAIAIMIATGGSAIIARKLGEGKEKEAQNDLSFLIVTELLIGVIAAVSGILFINHIIFRSKPDTIPAMRQICQNIIHVCASIFSSDCISDIFSNCGQTCIRPDRYVDGRGGKYGARLYFYGGIPYGNRRGGACYRIGILRPCGCRFGVFLYG